MGRACATAAAWWPPSPRRPPDQPNLSPSFLSIPPTAGRSAAPIGVGHFFARPTRGPPPGARDRRGFYPTAPRRMHRCAVAYRRGTGPQQQAARRPATRRRPPPNRHGARRRGRGVRCRQLARGAYCGYAWFSPPVDQIWGCIRAAQGKVAAVRASGCRRRRGSRITSATSRAATPPARHPWPPRAMGSAAKSIDTGDLLDPWLHPPPGRVAAGVQPDHLSQMIPYAVTPPSGKTPQRRATA